MSDSRSKASEAHDGDMLPEAPPPTSPAMILQRENVNDFNAISSKIYDEYKPTTSLELFAVESMIDAHWLSRRMNVLSSIAFDASWRAAAVHFAGIPPDRASVRPLPDGGVVVQNNETDSQVRVSKADLEGSQAISAASTIATFQSVRAMLVKQFVSLHLVLEDSNTVRKAALEPKKDAHE